MKKLLFVISFLTLSLLAQEKVPQQSDTNVTSVDSIEIDADSNTSKAQSYDVTQEYNLSAESGFYLDAALVDYSELTDCEEDAEDQMEEDALAAADLCPTRNIDIRLRHPIHVTNVQVTSRKLTPEECQLEATYTLNTLPPKELAEVNAVCQDEYEGYGASLMLNDGLWQGLQLSVGVGYSGGDVGTMEGEVLKGINPSGQVDYRYVGAPMMTTDAAYLYKLPVANLYVLGGAELGWVSQQTNTKAPTPNSDGEFEDGGSPYIFRVGVYGGLGYRFHMKYDIQSHIGYQFQYLYRTLKGQDPIQGYANNIVYSIRGAYHFHENFAGYVKFQSNLDAVNSSIGLTYEFWD